LTQITIDLPDSISGDEARLFLAAKLFELDKLSLGKAAELSGHSKSTFIELVSKMGIPVIKYPPDELEQEMALLA
jgi:predicted HTH domain antitoxin